MREADVSLISDLVTMSLRQHGHSLWLFTSHSRIHNLWNAEVGQKLSKDYEIKINAMKYHLAPCGDLFEKILISPSSYGHKHMAHISASSLAILISSKLK